MADQINENQKMTSHTQKDENKGDMEKFCSGIIYVFSTILIVLLLPISLPMCIKMVQVK